MFDGTQGVRGRSAWAGDHSLVEMSGFSRFLDTMIHIGQDTYCWPRRAKKKLPYNQNIISRGPALFDGTRLVGIIEVRGLESAH